MIPIVAFLAAVPGVAPLPLVPLTTGRKAAKRRGSYPSKRGDEKRELRASAAAAATLQQEAELFFRAKGKSWRDVEKMLAARGWTFQQLPLLVGQHGGFK